MDCLKLAVPIILSRWSRAGATCSLCRHPHCESFCKLPIEQTVFDFWYAVCVHSPPLTVWTWTNYLSSFIFSVCTYKMGIMKVPTTDSWENFFLTFLFWTYHEACGILVPQPGVKPRPPAVKTLSPNPWTARNSQVWGLNQLPHSTLGLMLGT